MKYPFAVNYIDCQTQVEQIRSFLHLFGLNRYVGSSLKWVVFLILLLAQLANSSSLLAQTNYYSQATGDPNNLATWGLNTDGSGAAPADFTSNNQIFNLTNSNPGAMTAAWTVSGTGSKIIVGDGVTSQTLSTSTFLLTATVDVSATGTLTVQSNSSFTLGTCASGSTVSYAGDLDQSVRTGTYHHLSLSNATATRTKTASGAITVNGDLTVDLLNTFAMTTFTLSGVSGSISGTGSITTTNTSTTPIPNGKVWTQKITFSAATSGVSSGTYDSLVVSTAGTKTAQGNITVNISLNISATLDLATNTLSGNFITVGTGTIQTQNTSATPIPIGKTWTQNITYNANGATQTVVKGLYTLALDVKGSGVGGSRIFPTNQDSIQVRGAFTASAASVTYTTTGTRFVFSGAAQTLTFVSTSAFNFELLSITGSSTKSIAGAGITADTLNVTSTLAMQTNVLGGNLNSIIGGGTISTTNTSATPFPAGKIWSQNITFSSTSSQTVPKGTYNLALNVAGASGSRVFASAGDTIEVKGSFTASGTSITYTTSGRRFLFSTSTATLTFSATSAFAFDWVSFSGAVTKTVAGASFSADTIIVNSGTTLAMATFALSGNLGSISGGGTITTTNVSATPFPAGKIWTQNITFSSTSSQTVPKGLYLANLSLSGASGSRVLPSNADTIEVRGNFTAAGTSITYTTTGTRFVFSGAAQTLTFSATSVFNFGLLSIGGSGTKTVATAGFSADTLFLPSGFTLNMVTFAMGGNMNLCSGTGTILTQCLTNPLPLGKTWSTYVNYNNVAGTQNVSGGIYEKLILTLTGSTSRSKTATGNITVNDSLVVSTSSTGALTLDMQSSRLIEGGSFQLINLGSAAKNFQTQCTDPVPFPVSLTWPTGTVSYNASADQSVVLGNYSSLTFSGTGNRSLAAGDIFVTATLTATSGPVLVGGTSTMRLTGAAQTIVMGASGSFNNFRVQGTGDKTVTAATGTLTVDGELEVAASRQLIMNTNALAGNITSTTGTGTITTTSVASLPLAAGKLWTPNITFSSTSSQNVPKGIYTANLNVAGGAGSRVFPTNGDTVEVRGNFTASSASITYTTTGTRFIFSGGAQTLTFSTTSPFNFGYVSMTGNSVTKTVANVGFSVDTLDIGSTATLNMVTFAITGNVFLTTGAGTITTQNVSATPVPLSKVWSPTLNYNADGTQSIVGGTYNKLMVSIFATARTKTATGNITVNDTLTLSSTGVAAMAFSMSTFQLINGGSFLLYNVGAAAKNVTTNYTNADSAQKALPTGQTWPGTVTYSSASHQTVAAGIYTSTLSVAGGARTFSALDTIEVRGAFTANTASVVYTNNGTFFYFSTGAQTLTFVSTSAFTFRDVSFGGSTVTKTIAGAGFSVSGMLNIDTTVTLNMVTFAMGGSPTSIVGKGIITTQCLLLALPAGKTWPNTVNYNDGAGTQNVIGGRYTYLTLTVNGTTTRTKNATDSVTVDRVITFSTNSSGGITLQMNTFRLIDGGSFSLVNSGATAKALTTACANIDTNFKPIPSNITWPGIVTYNAAGHQTVVTGVYTSSLIVTGGSRTFSAAGTIEVLGAFTANTASITYTTTNTTFLFSGGAQTLTFVSTSAFNFNHVSFTGSNITKTIAGTGFGVNGNLNVSTSVTLNMVTFLMGGNPQVISGAGTITTQATTGTPLPTGEIWTQTVIYNTNANQTISGGEYAKLQIIAVTSGTRVKTVSGANLKVNDTLMFSTTGAGIITLEMAANQLIAGTSFQLINSGATARNINTQSTASPALPSAITWPNLTTVTFNAAAGTQFVPSGSFYTLVISNTSGKTAIGNLTVRNLLTLTSANASSTKGALDMGDSTLTLLSAATISGTGDVSGIVKRSSMVSGVSYAFGQINTTINFQNVGTIPSEVSVKIKLGSAPSWKSSAIQRIFQIIQTGGSGTSATLRLHYLDAELNGNIENRMVQWRDSLGTIIELGRSNNDATNNYIELAPIDIAAFPSSFGNDSITLANSQVQTIVWEGSVSTVWTNALNWSTNITPDSTDNVTIPDSASTTFDPQVSATARVNRISIETGGFMNAVSGAQLSIYGNDSSGYFSWECTGSFSAGNSTVIFRGSNSGYSGITTFNNLTVNTGAQLTNRNGSVMSIAGSITNNGTWLVDSAESSVIYSGSGAQTVLTPNGSYTGYSSLSLSGTGAKTLPSQVKLSGDWSNTSTTDLVPRILFSGGPNQRITGTTRTRFNVLEIGSGQRVKLDGISTTILDSCLLTNGVLALNDSDLLVTGYITGSGSLASTAISNITLNGAAVSGDLRLLPDEDSVKQMIMSTSSSTIRLMSDLYVAENCSLNQVTLDLNDHALTLLGDYNETTASISGTAASHLQCRGTGNYTSSFSFTSGHRLLKLLEISRLGGTIVLNTPLGIDSLAIDTGILNLNGQELTLTGMASGNGTLSGNSSSNLICTGSGSTGTIAFTSGASQLNDLVLNRSSAGEFLMGSNLTINGQLNLVNGKCKIGNHQLTIKGSFVGSPAASLSADTFSVLEVSGTGGTDTIFFDPTVDGTTNRFDSVVIDRTASRVSMGNDLWILTSLNIINGLLNIDSNWLSIGGNMAGDATHCIASNGASNLRINGSGTLGSNLFIDQTVDGVTNRLRNLHLNRSSQTITLGNSLQLTIAFIPTAGTLASAGHLTLISNQNGTARILDGGCTTCSYITGNTTIQRFIPAVARRWRFIGTTVQSTTLDDWQDEIYITGFGGNANGFDQSPNNATSVFWYNETNVGGLNDGWDEPANISATLPPGRGYRLFVRGDRSDPGRINNTVVTQNSVTLDLVGVPNQGDLTMPVSCTFSGSGGTTYVDADDGWCLLSNPYPCPYDWDAHFSDGSFHNNIEPNIWILDANSFNNYISWNSNSHAGVLSNGVIPAGASFWVKANDASPTLTFKEQFKLDNNPHAIYKNAKGSFEVRLYHDPINADGVALKYITGATTNFDNYDTKKLGGPLSISAYGKDGIQLGLTCRPHVDQTDTIHLHVSASEGDYQLKFIDPSLLGVSGDAVCVDAYTNTVKDIKSTTPYGFKIVKDIPQTFGSNRFYLMVSNLLPSLLSFKGEVTSQHQVKLLWTTSRTDTTLNYQIERSVNDLPFEKLGTINAAHGGSTIHDYDFTDEHPYAVNLYRLKITDKDGSIRYSEPVQVTVDYLKDHIQIYPTPFHQFLNINAGTNISTLIITDLKGNEVYQKEYQSNNFIETDLSLLQAGIYIVNIKTADGKWLVSKSQKY